MSKIDLRPEQVKLLRFEKIVEEQARRLRKGKAIKVGAITAGLAAIGGATSVASAKLSSEKPLEYLANIEAAAVNIGSSESLIHLAGVVTDVHSKLELMADKAGLLLFYADGGGSKGPPHAEVVRLILMGG